LPRPWAPRRIRRPSLCWILPAPYNACRHPDGAAGEGGRRRSDWHVDGLGLGCGLAAAAAGALQAPGFGWPLRTPRPIAPGLAGSAVPRTVFAAGVRPTDLRRACRITTPQPTGGGSALAASCSCQPHDRTCLKTGRAKIHRACPCVPARQAFPACACRRFLLPVEVRRTPHCPLHHSIVARVRNRPLASGAPRCEAPSRSLVGATALPAMPPP